MGKTVIDRIIPIWRDEWGPIGAARDPLAVHDVVTWKGSTYICVQAHTADNDPNYGTEPGGIYTKYLWLKLAGGLECTTGVWNNSTLYYVGNCVIHGAASWIATIKHTNEVPNEHPESWFAASKAAISWRGIFDNTTNYVAGELVQYQNSVYYALSNTAGFQPTYGDGLTDFQMLVQGIYGSGNYQFLSTYTTGELVRVRGDATAAKLGGALYVQGTRAGAGSAQSPSNDASWIILADGLDFADAPSNTTRYYRNDILKYGNDIWSANQDCILGDTPAIDPSKFNRMVDQTAIDKIVEYDTSNLPNRLRVRFKRADSFMAANQPDWWQLYGYPKPTVGTGSTTTVTTGGGVTTDPDPNLPVKDPNATGSVLFPEGETTVDMLLVGGGGSGADPNLIRIEEAGTPKHIWRGCGGGGAGGVLSVENYPLNGKFKVVVGKGATHWDLKGGTTRLSTDTDTVLYKATGGGTSGQTGASSGGEKAYPFPKPDGDGELGNWWAQYTCEPVAPEAGFRGGRGDTSGFTGGGGGGGGAGGVGGDATIEAGGAAGKPVTWLDGRQYASGGAGCRQVKFEGVMTSNTVWRRYGEQFEDGNLVGSGGKGAMIVENDWSIKKTVAVLQGDATDNAAGQDFWGKDGCFVMRFKTGACDVIGGASKAHISTDTEGNTYYYFYEDDDFEIRANVDPDPNAAENTGVANFGAGDIDILLVGAGGYGGNRSVFYSQPLADYPTGGGGGGAGAFVSIEQVALSDGTYQVFVGASAAWDGTRNMTNQTNPLQGGHTILRDSTGIIGIAYGGGYPAYTGHQGSSSGQMAIYQNTIRQAFNTISQPTGTSTGPMFGHKGGNSFEAGGYSGWGDDTASGGGGGAGGDGGDASSGKGGDGGAPRTWLDGKDYCAGGAGISGNKTNGKIWPDGYGNGANSAWVSGSSSWAPNPAADGVFIIRCQIGKYTMATGKGVAQEDRSDGYSYLEMTESDTLILQKN